MATTSKAEAANANAKSRKRKVPTQNDDDQEQDGAPKRAKSQAKPVKCKPEPKPSASGAESKLSKASNGPAASASDDWTRLAAELIADTTACRFDLARQVTQLFAQDNTVPFIARYRKHVTGDMPLDKIRAAEQCVAQAKSVKEKSRKLLKSLPADSFKQAPWLQQAIQEARSTQELESLACPFKEDGKTTTLAARARAAGLQTAADELLRGGQANLEALVDGAQKGRATLGEVTLGVKHLLADTFAKAPELQTFVRKDVLKDLRGFEIECKKSKSAQLTDEDKQHFETYFDRKIPAERAQPHQVLAMNRGEDKKALSVKVVCPPGLKHYVQRLITDVFFAAHKRDFVLPQLCSEAMEDAWGRLLEKQLHRVIRSHLTSGAESSSYDVFARNLQQLLLQTPQRGLAVLGVDPGFKHGCKLALIDKHNEILYTGVFHLHNTAASKHVFAQVKDTMLKHDITDCKVAVGNGTACREAERFMADLISAKVFAPVKVEYAIVNESGASIYSVSETAVAELPALEPNLRSAVSIARRLQDPLSELVKIDPQHLGVGMYQHDLPKKELASRLDAVVCECVSFVGVDINTASLHLLRRVNGLSAALADRIVKARPFTSRLQLRKVKGLGAKTFEQCAGFVRIQPNTVSREAKSAKAEFNPLDSTIIHPESYDLAERLIKQARCSLQDVGSAKLRAALSSSSFTLPADVFPEILLVVQPVKAALQQQLMHDIRNDGAGVRPMFKQSITRLDQLRPGTQLTGAVSNVTSFGAFVDIGVHRDGLVHVSNIPRYLNLNAEFTVGRRLQVSVVEVKPDNKIALKFIAFDR